LGNVAEPVLKVDTQLREQMRQDLGGLPGVPELAELLRQHGIETPVNDDPLGRLNPFAVTFGYDDMDLELLTLEDAESWVTSVRRWAEEQVRAAGESNPVPGADKV
jgi:hypothetical protein